MTATLPFIVISDSPAVQAFGETVYGKAIASDELNNVIEVPFPARPAALKGA